MPQKLVGIALALCLALALAAAVLATTPAPDAAPSPAVPSAGAQECEGANLLVNPSFEGQYSAYDPEPDIPDCPYGICATAQMAAGWTPWWRSHNPADDPWIINMPEYAPADPMFTDPPRVRTGDAAQSYFKLFSTFESGFYQTLDVTPGATYCFSIWGHSWSADDDDDAYSGPFDGILEQKIGVDPSGGTDWQSASIIWDPGRVQYDSYGLFQMEVVAQASQMTFFVYAQPAYAVKHNDVHWDDASVTQVIVPQLNPVDPVDFLADVDTPGPADRPLYFDLIGHDDVTWSAAVEAGGTLSLVISPTTGAIGDYPLLSFDTTGLMTGTYTATLALSASNAAPGAPPVAGSPAAVPVTLRVLAELEYAFLPAVSRP